MMSTNTFTPLHGCRRLALVLPLLLCACSALRPTATDPPAVYALEAASTQLRTADLGGTSTLIVNRPGAAAGYDSSRIVYLRSPHELKYFAHSVWVEPPAHMLTPLLVAAVQRTGAFHAVVQTSTAAAGEFRLDTEVVRLQHEFQSRPSRVRFTLRANLLEERTRRVLASREFDEVVVASSEDPYGGVVAANQAVQSVLERLSAFCAETAASSRPGE